MKAGAIPKPKDLKIGGKSWKYPHETLSIGADNGWKLHVSARPAASFPSQSL